MALGNPYISIITLNVNGPNSPIKRHRVEYWIKKQNPAICSFQEIHVSYNDKYRLKLKGWKIIFQANNIHRKEEVAIFISDKMDFNMTKVTRNKNGNFIMIKCGGICPPELSRLQQMKRKESSWTQSVVPSGKGVAIPSSGECPKPFSKMAFIAIRVCKGIHYACIAHQTMPEGCS